MSVLPVIFQLRHRRIALLLLPRLLLLLLLLLLQLLLELVDLLLQGAVGALRCLEPGTDGRLTPRRRRRPLNIHILADRAFFVDGF